MTELPNGLRFDIYERVHLPDEVAAIEELEEIELVPHIRVLPQDDSVLLSGHLLLSGVYRAQQSQDLAQLEHWIPVEITLPLNRVSSVDELAVEIDNFDVDVLSTRSLNVTGVLALRGLQADAGQAPIWKDDSFTVVHQAQPSYAADFERDSLYEPEPEPEEPEVSISLNESIASAANNDVQAIETERVEVLVQAVPAASSNDDWLSAFKAAEEPPQEQARTASAGESWGDVSLRQAESSSPSASAQDTPPQQPVAVSVPGPIAQQAAEPSEPPRINLTTADQTSRAQSGVALLSQLGDIGAKRESEQKQQEAAQAEEKAAEASQAPSSSTGDELEWTRLFLNSAGEAQSFRKVRICIVQRDDTLEGIANRYNVQPRALQLHNQLNDPYLSEGQVLYIP